MISKLPNVGISIFTKMTALAQSVGAINLSQGFPGFDPDSLLIERLAYHASHGKNQYSPASGVAELRTQIGLLYDCNPDTEVTVTSGAAEALFCAIATVVSKGDEVIIIEPAYDLYAPAVETQGAVPVFVQMKYPDFAIDWQEVEDKITSKTKLIIVNTPHNPTGKVLQESDITALEEIVSRHPELLLVSDEVYEHIVFDGNVHLSLRDSEILRDRTFMCSSFAKTFHITGWKMGYCIAPSALSEEFRKVHQYVTFCSFTPAQYAIADYLESSKAYLQLSAFYQKKRDLFLKALNESDFKILTSEGTFFQNVSYAHLSERSDVEVSTRLTEKLGVASIPTSVFYNDKTNNKILRFCFAKDDETLLKAAERLKNVAGYL
jgi:methionine aminotransferase